MRKILHTVSVAVTLMLLAFTAGSASAVAGSQATSSGSDVEYERLASQFYADIEAALASGATSHRAVAIDNPLLLPPPSSLLQGQASTDCPPGMACTASATRSQGDVTIDVTGSGEIVDDWLTFAQQYSTDGYVCPVAIFESVASDGFVDEEFRGSPTECGSGDILWLRAYPYTPAYYPDGTDLCNRWESTYNVFWGRPCIGIHA